MQNTNVNHTAEATNKTEYELNIRSLL